MDKYEYKVRADEINRLIAEGDYAQAAEIADDIDWRRVKSVMMLCTVSDLYKINRRYDDAKNMLLLAYERRPGGRTICYSLCELCIKTEDFVQAVNFYKEFVQAAPKDPGRYVLQYKIYEAQDVSLEERIGVLEELKKRDYREKWAYELAYLYHRVGLATRCVEECDELILWFGEGKYVVKAMELKMLHQPLTPAQQEVYDHRFEQNVQEPAEEISEPEAQEEIPDQRDQGGYGSLPEEQEDPYGQQESWNGGYGQDEAAEEAGSVADAEEEMDIQVKTVDVGKFNTINLQEELAAGLQEVLGADEITRSLVEPMLETDAESEDSGISLAPEDETFLQDAVEDDEEVEVFFGETGELKNVPANMVREIGPEDPAGDSVHKGSGAAEAGSRSGQAAEEQVQGTTDRECVSEKAEREGRAGENGEGPAAETDHTAAESEGPAAETGHPAAESEGPAADQIGNQVMEQMREEAARGKGEETVSVQPPKELAGVLSQESDGQIRLVVPESAAVEKQITGQMKIEDILAEWERMKRKNQEKCREEVRQHVLQQTGPMFTEFEAAVRDGLLEQLETDPEETEQEAFEEMMQFSGDGTEPDGEDEIEELTAFEEEAASDVPEGAAEEVDEAGHPDEYLEDDSESGEYFGETGGADGFLAEDPEEEDYLEETEDSDDLDGSFEEDGEAEGYSQEPEDPEGSEEDSVDSEPGMGSDPADFDETEDFDEFLEDDSESEDYADSAEDTDSDMDEDAEEDLDSTDEDAEEDLDRDADADLHRDADEFIEGSTESELKKPSDKRDKPKGIAGQKKAERQKPERQPIERDKAKVRALTREEKELYAPFIQSRRSREQLVKAIDNVSMAAYTGNIVITGEEGMDTLTLAKNMIREIKMADSNFAGKVAKIAGQDLNDRNVRKTLEEMNSGALIIYKASGMNPDTARALYRSLQQERLGIIVVLEDTKKAIQRLFLANQELAGAFTARVDMEALSNDMLVLFGKRYAREMEYSIDELGVLALHTRIEELQTIDHVVTVVDVKRIVDEAIRHASRKTLGHFFDILLAKRYDDEDMVVLTEKDFVA